MNRFLKTSAITLLGALALAPWALGRDHTVILYQSASGNTWYSVATEKTNTAPVYTYSTPGTNSPVYIYQASAPARDFGNVKVVASDANSSVWIDGEFAGTTEHIMRVALEAGNHSVELRDSQGNRLFSGDVKVVAGQTTQVRPQ